MGFDIAGARQAGYSDEEVAGFLATRSLFDIEGARKAGWGDEEIIGFLTRKAKAREPAPSADELESASRPAQMTLTRGGQSQLQANTPLPEDKPTADWGDVATSLPAQFVAGTRGAVANLQRMGAEEGVAQREEALQPAQADPSGWGALVRPSAIARQRRNLEEDRAAVERTTADAAQAARDMRLVTPESMTIAQDALSSLAQSSGPTLLGLAAGILTRNVPMAFAIAGGGGAAQQAGSTYGEAREHGATHRQASVAATIDAVLEGAGEALPLGVALKPGTPVFKRIFGTLAREAGQESATQLAQDFRAMSMENPNLTLGEVWRNVRVAALAGAGGGAVYGGAGAAANWSRERELRLKSEAENAAVVNRIGQSQSVDEAITVAAAAVDTEREWSDLSAAIGEAMTAVEAEAVAPLPGAAPAGGAAAEQAARPPTAMQLAFERGLAAAAQRPSDAAAPESAEVALPPSEPLAAPTQAPVGEIPLEFQRPAYGMRHAAASTPAREDEIGAAASTVDQAAHEAASSPANDLSAPSKEQILAGNAKLGHPKIAGMAVSIENPAGSVREDKHHSPPRWKSEMRGIHYGYLPGTTAADSTATKKQGLDVFVKEGTPQDWSGTVYVVNQAKGNGQFDEHKGLLGYASEAEARSAYLAQYEAGWERRILSIVPMPTRQFKAWATDQTKDGPRGGEARPIAVLGKTVERLTSHELEVASRKARTPAQREGAKAELLRRGEAAPAQAQRAAEPAPGAVLIHGRPAAQYSVRALELVAKAGSPALKAAARAELDRRGVEGSAVTPTPKAQEPASTAPAHRAPLQVPPAVPPAVRGVEAAETADEMLQRVTEAHPKVEITLIEHPSGVVELQGIGLRDETADAGQGLGAAALRDIAAWADANGRGLMLMAQPNRGSTMPLPKLVELYERHGFKRWAEQPYEDAVMMNRDQEARSESTDRSEGAQRGSGEGTEAVARPAGSEGVAQRATEAAATGEARGDEEVARSPSRVLASPREDSAAADARAADHVALRRPYEGAGGDVKNADRARPDVIRQTIRDMLDVPINERGVTIRKAAGIYKTQARTIRVRNQNDIDVIVHEVGHHLSETNRPLREKMAEHYDELASITPYAQSQKTRALKQEEGFAEFIRLHLTQREVAESRAPGFYAAFEQFLDESQYRPILEEIHGLFEDWHGLDAASRILAKVGKPRMPFGDRVAKLFDTDRAIFEVLDNWLPMKRMVQDLAPKGIPASKDPHIGARLLAGDAAIVEDWLLRGTVPFDYARRADPKGYGKPLAEILKPVAKQEREFSAYLIARRARQLAMRGKENLYRPDEIAAAMRLETPALKEAAKELYEYQDQLLDYAVEGGLLSERSAEKFKAFADYVPFFREGTTEGKGTRGNVFKRIEGGTENLRDPIENVIQNAATIIYATNRNAVLQKALQLAKSVPGGGRWIEEIPMPQMKVRIETKKVVEAFEEQGVQLDRETAEHLATMQTFFVPDTFGDEGQRIIIVRENGQPKALQVNAPMLWEALQAFKPIDIGIVGNILALPSDLLRAGVTTSPDFMARNFMRDTLSGFMQSKKGLIPLLGTLDGFKEVATRSDAARLYRAFGGAYGDMWKGEPSNSKKVIERMARRGGFDAWTIATPRGLFELLHRIGSVSEAGTRVAEFKRTMKAGDVDSLVEAAFNAREVSVDFGLHGHNQNIRFLTRITPFLNPALQGFYKMGRTGRDQMLTTLLRGSILTAFSVLLYLNNRDEEWYDEIERWERNSYWHVDLGIRSDRGDVIPIRIPKPFEWGALFGSVPETLTKVAIDKRGEAFAKRLRSVFADAFGLRVVPTAVLVPAELWANRNTFTDRPIVPESREKLDPMLQYTPTSSEVAKEMGKLSGTSPAKIDHAIRGFFGTMGTYATGLADLTVRAAQADAPERPPALWTRMPVVKAFVRDPDSANSIYVNDFYKFLAEARTADATLKRLTGDDAEVYLAKHRKEIEEARGAGKVAREIAKLRKENDQVRADRDLSGMEKADLYAENNRMIRWLARDFMKDLSQVEPRQ